MSLNKFLIELLIQERSIVEELLAIDNKIQFTNLTFEQLLNSIKDVTNEVEDIPMRKYDFITDGEIKTVLNCLINYAPFINHLNINKRYVGINKWLINHINDYYENNNINIHIILDIDNNYRKFNDSKVIVVCGFKEFVEGTSLLFENKKILKIEM